MPIWKRRRFSHNFYCRKQGRVLFFGWFINFGALFGQKQKKIAEAAAPKAAAWNSCLQHVSHHEWFSIELKKCSSSLLLSFLWRKYPVSLQDLPPEISLIIMVGKRRFWSCRSWQSFQLLGWFLLSTGGFSSFLFSCRIFGITSGTWLFRFIHLRFWDRQNENGRLWFRPHMHLAKVD